MNPAEGRDNMDSSGAVATGDPDSTATAKGRKVHTSFRINPVVEVFGKMKGEKERIVKEVGLHGLTSLPKEETMSNRAFNCQFAFWLLQKFNYQDGSLDLGLRGTLYISCEDVGLVLARPCSGEDLKKSDPLLLQQTKQLIKKQLLLEPEDDLTLVNVAKVLERDIINESSDAEKRAFITACYIFAVSYFLAPKGRPAKVNNEILECLLHTSKIESINWASYVLLTLREASDKVKKEVSANTKSVTLDGCLLLLQIVYLDNMDFGQSSPLHHAVPRVKDFSFQVLERLIEKDKKRKRSSSGREFGVARIRGEEDTAYSHGNLYRAILLSRDRLAGGSFLHTDKQQILAYLTKIFDEGKRKIRLASEQFEKEACECMEHAHKNMVAILEMWKSSSQSEVIRQPKNTAGDGCALDDGVRKFVLDKQINIMKSGDVQGAKGEAGTSNSQNIEDIEDMKNACCSLAVTEKKRKGGCKVLAHKKKVVKVDGVRVQSTRENEAVERSWDA